MTFLGKKRIHIGLTTAHFQEALGFYKKFFQADPSKLREGYAKFELESPPLNFTLNETRQKGSFQRLSHLGVQVKQVQDVKDAQVRFSEAGLGTRMEENTSCCYAVQDKVWVKDPDGNSWETFVVHRDEENEDESKTCCG